MAETTNCACECHQGKRLYHVRWKPCCASPVDGGIPKKIYGCTMTNGEIRLLIASSKDEAVSFWKSEFGLEPIEESVVEVS